MVRMPKMTCHFELLDWKPYYVGYCFDYLSFVNAENCHSWILPSNVIVAQLLLQKELFDYEIPF